MILKLSNKKIIARLAETTGTLITILVAAYFIGTLNMDYWLLTTAFTCLGVLPSIFLFSQYLYYTRKLSFVNIEEGRIIIKYNNGKIVEYNFDELALIKLYKSAGMDKGNFTLGINESYYYAELITNTKNKIILTSLLGPDLNDGLDLLKDVPVDRLKSGFAFI